MTKIIAIGDPHFQISNIVDVDIFINKIEELAKREQPDLIVILGDLLHTHERVHTTALNKAYYFVDKMRLISLTYVLVGNHDMCLGKDVPVLTWDGKIKLSQDIKINDQLIGDDGKICTVTSVCSGKNDLYKIDQLRGDSYIVTKNHLLSFKLGFHKSMFWNNAKKAWSVKWIETDSMTLKSKLFSLNRRDPVSYKCKFVDINEAEQEAKDFKDSIKDISTLDISVEKYLTIPKNVRDRLYCYRTDGVNWPSKDVFIDPYILGMWLGDGCKKGYAFASADIDLINKWCDWANINGAKIIHSSQYNYTISKNTFSKRSNRIPIGSIESSVFTCKACIRHKNIYNRAPSVACLSISEMEKILKKDQDFIKHISENASIEQIRFIQDPDRVKKQISWKIKFSNMIKRPPIHPVKNPLKFLLEKYNLINNKHIPNEYLCNDENVRLQLLAGFIDTDGTTTLDKRSIIISQCGKNMHLIDEFAKISRSLGFSTHIQEDFIKYASLNSEGSITRQMTISGDIEKIPIVLEHKKCLPIMNNGIDIRGRKCADKLKSGIKVTYMGIGDYYGFKIDNKSERFLLGDFTVTHNCNNQIYLTDDHWMNGMKEWENVVIVDKVKHLEINGDKFTFCPYVYPGRFQEALNTTGDEWKDSNIIFAHQEFAGCKMGPIISVDGDNWPLDYPNVISGHIHSKQTPQKNVYYCGSAMQHAFGESEDNIIPIITKISKQDYKLEEMDLIMPRKKIVYMDVNDIDSYTIPPKESEDTIKLTIDGLYDEFKAFKKTSKYKEITDSGVKVVFKAKKIKKDLNDKLEVQHPENDFRSILNNLVKQEKNSFLTQAYELIVNNKNEDVLIITKMEE